MIAELNPHPDNPLMEMAWLDCLHWAIGHDEIRAGFEADTGARWPGPRTPLDRMIDEATGFKFDQEEYFRKFIVWFNENVWGEVPSAE